MQREKLIRSFFKSPRFLAIALALTVLLTMSMGTLAWLKYSRSQQTVTLVRVSDHYLLGPDGSNTTAVNLGNIDVSAPGSQFYAFGVKSNQPSYRFQLAYTTNIPFTYKIHRAIKAENGDTTYATPHSEGGYTFYYNQTALEGSYLNLSSDNRTATDAKHEITFGSSTVSAQKNAEPVYWHSKDVDRLNTTDYIDYFVLEVTWSSAIPNDKETDMIYLTVGAPVGGSQ